MNGCNELTVVLVHSHRAVDVRCRNLSGNMAIDLVGNRYLDPNMDRRAERVVPICDDTFDSTDSGRLHRIDFQREYGSDNL